MSDLHHFPTDLKLDKYRIERIARREGLDMFTTRYEVVNDREMAEIAARNGFPTTEHHWRYGQESLARKKQFRYGLSVIYEMVVNTDISYAYLLERNLRIDQKSVMAHVCGHVDFFKHNAYFAPTDRDMLNARASDARLVQEYCERIGRERVKEFLDWVLSFEWYVDPHSPYHQNNKPIQTAEQHIKDLEQRLVPKRIEPREALGGYMDEYLNPPDWLDTEKDRLAEGVLEEIDKDRGVTVPKEATRDLLGFIAHHAPLEYWQRDLIIMVRRHSLYFVAQARTKIMNEGWASLWQEHILNDVGMMNGSELMIHCNHLAGVQRKRGGLNPYRLGVDLWRDIWSRWDTGRHGDVWDCCTYANIKNNWSHFAVYKTIFDEHRADESAIQNRWQEFSAFVEALRMGHLKIPSELFARNQEMESKLIPTWCRYLAIERDYKRFAELQKLMEPLELQTILMFGSLRKTAPATMPDDELQWKARRQVYQEAGREDAWLWTLSEVKAELVAIQALMDFGASWKTTYAHIPAISIPVEWHTWASKNHEPMILGKGREKMFEVRTTHDDQSFLLEFFTHDFCEENKYFVYKVKGRPWNPSDKHAYIDTRSFRRIKRRLLLQYVNLHMPIIRVEDANYDGKNGLYLIHEHQGIDLDFTSKDGRYMKDVLQRLFWLWGGQHRVYLETIVATPPKERPWWENWVSNTTEDSDETPMVDGSRVLFTYGLKDMDSEITVINDPSGHMEHYDFDELETVTFPAPY